MGASKHLRRTPRTHGPAILALTQHGRLDGSAQKPEREDEGCQEETTLSRCIAYSFFCFNAYGEHRGGA